MVPQRVPQIDPKSSYTQKLKMTLILEPFSEPAQPVNLRRGRPLLHTSSHSSLRSSPAYACNHLQSRLQRAFRSHADPGLQAIVVQKLLQKSMFFESLFL